MAAAKASVLPFLVSYGAEDYFLDLEIEKMRAWKDRQPILLDGEGMPDHEIVSLCETYSEMPRVIIVDFANKVKGDKALKAYIANKLPTDVGTVLGGIIRSDKLPEVWKNAAEKGRLKKYEKFKTFDNNNEVVKWLEGEMKRAGLRPDVGIAQTIYNNVGPDLHRLANEVRKLTLLVPAGEKTTVQHVRLVISPSPIAEPYEVADAAISKDPHKAMNVLSTVYRAMGEEANVPITASLIKSVERVVVARRVLDRGGSEEDVAARLGMNFWRYKTHLMPHVRKHDHAALVRHMSRLCRLDVDVKGSARSKRTLVELAVLSIATATG